MKKAKSQLTVSACIRANDRTIQRFAAQGQHPQFSAILDFGYVTDPVGVAHALRKIELSSPSTHRCIRLMINDPNVLEKLNADLSFVQFKRIIVASPTLLSKSVIAAARKLAEQVFVEIYSDEMAFKFRQYKPDGFVIRGNEAGGICSNMSNPTIFRRIREKISEPIWIYGGIGPQSILAYAIGGADGVILSDALSLMPELIDDFKEHDIRSLKAGVRTQSIDIGNRMHMRVSEAYPELSLQIRELCVTHDRRQFESSDQDDSRLTDLMSLIEKQQSSGCFMGEEIAWAAQWHEKYDSITALMEALTKEVDGQLEILRNDFPFSQGNALAKSLKAEYPILQGPMTHVSDAPAFLAAVSRNGAIPFAALGTNSGEQVEQLMGQTRSLMDGRPWGVGIIGFAPKAVQDEQFEAIQKYKPDMAVVAGGRPQHYKTLREMGIMPFVHIPVPSMIANFFKEGVRHFIFEGRGCGGHIGPINSYTLWQAALIEFQQLADAGQDLSDVRIAFAGGIYDAVSAAMTSAFSVPLLEHGVQFCFIVGTAYLFTKEIIQSSAISPVFQKVALDSDNTVVMEGAAGHALRCAQTALISEYARKRVALINEGLPPTEVHLKLEDMNIGRLRLAAKGVMFNGVTDGKAQFIPYSEADQEKEGLYMIGEVATLMENTISMADLHRTICSDPPWVIDAKVPIALDSTRTEQVAVDVKATDIAIIGLSSIVPGADDLDEFWHNVLSKMYCITDVPGERWDTSKSYHADPNNKDTCYSRRGGFLGEIPINCMEWGIPPGSMKNVDPSQLLALEAVKRALADAGYENRKFDREKTSVIFGFAGGGDLLIAYSVRAALREYMHRAEDIPDEIRSKVLESVNDVLPEWTEDSFPGILGNIIAGRVANRFNINGLNFTMDAACASSMAALKVACQELVYGTTKTAIVGGVDASQHPFGFTLFSKTKALSLSDESKPFSHDADGIILGEGVGVLVLKRLEDAIKDNDRVYAVIKGMGGASDGKGSGMTVPVPKGQKIAVQRAYDVAGFKLDTVDLVEAHGTGTPLGDRVELETLNEVLQDHGASQPLAVGSIKSSIGHTKGAAGVIGVIKAAMALHHKVLPAHANVEKVHKAASHPNTRLYVNIETRPWFRRLPDQPRRAAASAFGFGGTNFHTVMEEYADVANRGAKFPSAIWPTELFLFSAKDTKTIIKRIDATLASLEKDDATIAQIAHAHYKNQLPAVKTPVRLAVKADSIFQLKEKLTKCKSLIQDGKLQAGQDGSRQPLLLGQGIWGTQIDSSPGPLTALFPGQGAQKLDMLKDLALVFPVVRECMDNANAILEADFFPAAQQVLTDYIYPPAFDKDAQKEALQALTNTTVAQPAIGAVEMALYRLLKQFNVKIEMTAGHSFGELTALWAAGVLTDRQLLTLAGMRGRCMAGSSDVPTGMTAVQTNRETLKDYVDSIDELSIANHNTPKQVVVSGSLAALDQFEVWCKEQKLGYKRLSVSQGFHSPFMDAAAAQWQAALALENFLPAGMPVFSNMTAEPYGKSVQSITDTLGNHLRNGVRFVDEIEAMYSAGARTFIEIGPGAILTNFVGAILGDKPHRAVAAQPSHGKSGVEMLQDCLATLFASGYDIDMKPAYSCRLIPQKKKQPEPSPTLFMVNGGRARPTVPFKTKEPSTPQKSRWEDLHAGVAAKAAEIHKPPQAAAPANVDIRPNAKPVDPKPADQSGTARQTGKQPSGVSAGAMPMQFGPVAAPVLSDQEKLKKMKYFQQSMNLFLETQERFQKQRIEMMEKMWQINQQLFQGLLGQQVPQMPMPSATNFSAEAQVRNQTATQPAASQWAMPQSASFEPQTFTATPPNARQPQVHTPDMTVAAPVPEKPAEQAATVAAPIETPPVKVERVDYKTILFDIISERTQYPVDMLSPDQEIDGDLGIDSIKRVEIISMLQEKDPALADVADEKYFEDMAQLKTLGDIVDWLNDTFGGPVAADAVEQSAAPQTAMPQTAAVKVDYKTLLFDIISERTQYPVDMLSPDQEIDGDLGIDSIKRVEIISMLQEKDPALADVADEKYFEDMAQLKTLGDIVNWLNENFGQPTDVSVTAQPAQQAAAATQTVATQVDYQALLFEVISDRTQYPVDMLSVDQEIDGDLGIDSIKRVEIISMLEGAHPSLADISNEKYFEDMAQLKTLGDIVNWLKDNFGADVAAASPQAFSPSQSTSVQNQTAQLDYQTLLFQVISERTQYPVDMLSPEQEIDGDLGIDSIKRVEIISMLEESHPSLADISNEKYFEDMAQLKTLGDIVNWLKNNFGETQPDVTPATISEPAMAAEVKEVGVVDYQALLFSVISDRTQYPVDMLSPEQEIDGDLGIDSIKRVEIISMLEETHPSLADISNEKYFEDMAQLKTLGDIVNWLKDTFGQAKTAETTAMQEQTHNAVDNNPPEVLKTAPLDCRQLVIDVISERTLYPAPLIKMKMRLEEELDVDSNLLRELIRIITDAKPNGGPVRNRDNEAVIKVKKMKTVQDLVEFAEAIFAKSASDYGAQEAAAAQQAEPEDAARFHRLLLKLVERPIDLATQQPINGVFLILDGGHPICSQVQKDAEKIGIQCVRVTASPGDAEENKDCISMAHVDEEHCQKYYKKIKKNYGPPAGVLNMLALGKSSHEEGYDALMQTFYWAKTIGADKALMPYDQKQFFWISVSGMGGDFGLNNTVAFEACQNGPHGITKSLFHEWSGVRAKTIDILADDNPEKLSQAIINECREPNAGPKEVGLQNGKRYETTLAIRPIEDDGEASRFTSESVFLITGGAKGITADVAKLLAELYAPTIILTGRTPMPERSGEDMEAFFAKAAAAQKDPRQFKAEIIQELKSSGKKVSPADINARYNTIMNEYKARQNIDAMRQFNAKVVYHACDCTDEQAFSELIRQLYRKHDKIDGVIHAAGYLKDGQITQKPAGHFRRVIDTKVKGAKILLDALDFEKLEFISFFSSVAGRFGNQGQSDYAAANEILNKMAVKINHQWPGKASAINWAPWEGEGMVSDQVKKQFAAQGIYLLPRSAGARMFNQEINFSSGSAEVIIFGADDIENRLPVVRDQDDHGMLPFAELFKPIPSAEKDVQAWELTLDQKAPYLNDHRIDGVAVLPAAVAMEIMAQAAAAAKPGYRFNEIRDFKLIKGITMPSQEQLKLLVTAKALQNGIKNGARVDVQLKTDVQAERCNYASGVILTKTNGGKVPTLRSCRHSKQFELPLEQVYQIRLFQDGVFRGIKNIESYEIYDLENNGIRGIVGTSKPEHILGRPTRGKWLVDPVTFDCAYQLASLWIQECYDSMAMLGNVKKYIQYRAYNGGPIYCDVNAKVAGYPKVIMDFNFTDETGRLYAQALDAYAIMKKTLDEKTTDGRAKVITMKS